MPDLDALRRALRPAVDPLFWTIAKAFDKQRRRYLALAAESVRWTAEEAEALFPEEIVPDPAWTAEERADRLYALSYEAQCRLTEHMAGFWSAYKALLEACPQATVNLPTPNTDLQRLDPAQAASAVRQALAVLAQHAPAPALPKRKQRGLSKNELNVLVANYLAENRNRWQEIAAREIAEQLDKRGHKTSKAAIVSTPAWRAFEEERKKRRPSKPRTVPLTDKMLAAIPDRDEELQRLIEEQQAEIDEEDRRCQQRRR